MSEREPTIRTTVRAPESLLEQFDKETEGTRSAAIRRLMIEEIEEQSNRQELNKTKLANAYEILLRNGHEYESAIRCTAATVVPVIANKCNVAKDEVRNRILRPLRSKGYIVPRAGYLWIKPRGIDPAEWSVEL